ncbi:MAG TPA: hypothetical protein VFD80_08870 [Flavobacteriaceae bacterium]|nr:hypothetical protein [Flavobacteriaceae bacterium]
MKSIVQIGIISMLMIVSSAVRGQIGSAEAQVNLSLAQVMSVEVGHNSVVIPMDLPVHFQNGNSSGELINHLQVNSILPYFLRVRAEESTFSLDGMVTPLPVSVIRIDATVNSGTGVTTATPLYLSASSGDVLQSTANEVSQSFNVSYSIPQAQTSSFLNREPGVYTTTVIYTIVPQ